MKTYKSLLLGTLMIFSLISAFSCSSDDNSSSGSSYKITITLNDVNATDDFISIVVVGSNQSGVNNYPMWKINGVNQENVQTISLGKSDFTGITKTYVMETVNPIEILTSGVQIINYGNPLIGNFKIEKNGTILINQDINLVGDNSDFTQDYSYSN